MQKVQIRTRTGSISDMHIMQCDCSHCDGIGELVEPFSHNISIGATTECPACEGMGYLEPVSQEAYEAYLSDLYKDVVRKMPTAYKTGQQYPQPGPVFSSAA